MRETNPKQSFYNYYLVVKGRFYVYNTLSTSIVELDSDSWNGLKSDDLQRIPAGDIPELREQGFIVDDGTDEFRLYQYYYDQTRYRRIQNHLNIVLIPTYGCNLRCPYCYEGEDKNNLRMTMDDLDAIIAFIGNQIDVSKESAPIKNVRVTYYGGEPLLCKDEIGYFSKKMSEICARNEISLKFQMVSNFTLADDDTIDMLRRYNIHTQITIDGTKKYHDKRRIYASGKGTYDIIVDNLKKACSKGLRDEITIRVNVDKENVDDIGTVFGEMTEYSGEVYFGMLTHYAGFNDCYESNCVGDSNASGFITEKLDVFYEKNGLKMPRRFGKRGPCGINGVNSFVIDPHMDVYKCDMLINHRECAVGKIGPDGRLHVNGNYYHQMCHSPFEFEQCRKCKLMPVCAGGCVAKQYIALGRKDGCIDLTRCDWKERDLLQYLEKYIESNAE